MERVAFKMYLKPGCEAEYEKRHHEIWPELVSLLKETGTYDYSIFWDMDANFLFAVQKSDGKASAKDLGSEPIVQKWWAYMADLMDTNPDKSPVVVPLQEVFHMD